MMEENQLQPGAIETNPVNQPEATTPVQETFVPENIDPNELPSFEDDLPVLEEEALVVPLREDQVEEGRVLFTSATANTDFYTNPLTFTPQYFAEHVTEALDQLETQDKTIRRQAMQEMLSSPDLAVDARIEIARQIGKDAIDANIVSRAAMVNAAVAQADNEPDDIAAEMVDQAALAAEELPNQAKPAYLEDYADGQEYLDLSVYNVVGKIQEAYQTASTNVRGSDIMGSMVPGAYQQMTSEIASILGLTFESYGAYLADGSVMRRAVAPALEQMYREAVAGGAEERRRFSETVTKVLDVLKNQSGTFDDMNNAIIANVLERAFPKIIRNESADPLLRGMEQTDELRQAKLDMEAANRKLEASLAAGDVLGQREAEEARRDARQRIINGEIALLQDPNDITFEEWIGNFTAIDDLALVGGLLKDFGKGVFNFGTRNLPRMVKQANKAAPDIAIQAVQRGLTESGDIVLGSPITKEELLQSILPSTRVTAEMSSAVNAAPAVIRAEQEALEQAKAVVGYMHYSADEQAEAFGEITENFLKNTDAAPAALNVAGSTINLFRTVKGDTAVTVEGLFGATKGMAFASAKQAREAAQRVFGSDANIQLYRYSSGNGGKLVPVDEKAWGKGKFYFSTSTNIPYEAARNVNQKLAFGDGHIRPGFINRLWWKTAGKVGQLTFQPLGYMGTVFSREWTVAANAAFSMEKFMKAVFVKQIQRATDGLADDEWDAVNAALRMGSTQQKAYTRTELETVLKNAGYRFSDKIADSYYSYRRAMDGLYSIMDEYARKRLLAGGYEELVGPLGRIGFGVRRALPKETIEVFDATRNAIVRMTPSELRAAEKTGFSLYELERGFRLGKKETTFVLNGGPVQARALPSRGVLPRVEGYVPKVYKAPYIIYGIKDGMERVIGTAMTKDDAAKLVSRLESKKAKGKGLKGYTKFGTRADTRTATMGEAGALAEEILNNLGGLGFGQRTAKRLMNGSADIDDNMLEPIEAAIRAADAVTYQVTKGDMLRQMEQRALAMAKAWAKGEEKVKLVSLEDYIRYFREKGWNSKADKLSAVVAQMNVARSLPDAVALTVEQLYTALERAFSAVGLRTAAAWAARKAARRQDPILGSLMGFLHFVCVATNFTGQLALQLMQPFLLAGLGPTAVVKGYTRTVAAWIVLSMRKADIDPKLQAQWIKRVAPFVGMTPDELTDFAKAAERSGIFQSVTNDTRMRIAARDRSTELMLRRAQRKGAPKNGGFFRRQAAKLSRQAGRAEDTVVYYVENVGFVWSEMANQLITFSTLYSRDKAKGAADLASRKYLDDLVGRTREITGSMNPESSYGFQRGFFKPMFQFVAFPWKMTQLVLPEKLGGARTLSLGEKNGILAAQFIMYGAAGVPFAEDAVRQVNKYVLSNVDALGQQDPEGFAALWMSEEVQAALQGYIMDRAINALLGEIEPGTELNISGRFAPLGGTEFAVERFLEPILNPDSKPIIDLYLGMPGATASKMVDFIRTAWHVSLGQMRDLDTVPFDQRLEQLGKEGGALLVAQYRRELALEMADAMDGFAMGGGYISQEQMTGIERMAFRLFNVETTDREQYWRLREEHRRRKANMDPQTLDDEASKYANDYFNQLLRNNAMWHDQLLPAEKIQMLRDDWIGQQALLFSVAFDDDPDMAERVFNKTMEKVNDLMQKGERTTAEQQLVDDLTADIRANVLKDIPTIANYFLQSKTLNDAQKAQVQQAVFELFEAEETQ